MHCGRRARYQRCSGCGRSQVAASDACFEAGRASLWEGAHPTLAPYATEHAAPFYPCEDLAQLVYEASHWLRGMLRVVESIAAVAPRGEDEPIPYSLAERYRIADDDLPGPCVPAARAKGYFDMSKHSPLQRALALSLDAQAADAESYRLRAYSLYGKVGR